MKKLMALRATTETRKRIEEANMEATDWRVQCRECGKWRVGTLAQLRKPCDHGEQDSD